MNENVQTIIIKTLKEVQNMSGQKWNNLVSTLVPIQDLDGFDSLLSVEVTVLIEEKFGCGELTDESNPSLFISNDGKKALSIGEIADEIEKRMKNKQIKNER